MENKTGLADMRNYTPENYFSETEIALIQTIFSNPEVIKVLRKILIPTISDPDLPIEQYSDDFMIAGTRDYAQIPESEIKSIVLARQEAIKFIAGGLIRIKIIAAVKGETSQNAALRKGKDSSK